MEPLKSTISLMLEIIPIKVHIFAFSMMQTTLLQISTIVILFGESISQLSAMEHVNSEHTSMEIDVGVVQYKTACFANILQYP